MIEFEIDGKKYQSEQGKMIIEVADAEGVYIPRFCYHRKLSIAANCRMCLVEVEKSAKPLPACATPITPGMKVFTKSEKAVVAQRAVMEFLLINHPLDCPICDQGGECELQDLSMGYGNDLSRYTQPKRAVHDKNLGPLISSEMTRCIQCTRCVRFGDEIAGMRELGAYNRGEHMEIGTYVEHMIKSELSGNIIDICPVGALTSKPYRFSARAWEMQQHPSIAPHDCLGSNIYIHTRGEDYRPNRHVMRVVPRDNESINENWISDRDRFGYVGLESQDRLQLPMVKQNNQWQATNWEVALNQIVASWEAIIKHHNANQIGAIASSSSTIEEFYLLQKLLRGMGSNNIDHRSHQSDFSDQQDAPIYPSLGIALDDLEKQDTIVLIGSNIRHEQPMACHRVRKATLQDAKVISISAIDYVFNFELSDKLITDINDLPFALARLASALEITLPKNIKYFADVSSDKTTNAIAKKIKHGEKISILLGAQALNHAQSAIIKSLARLIAEKTSAKTGYLTDGANSAGAWLAGAVPHRGPAATKIAHSGHDVKSMFTKSLRSYLLMNVEPEFDFADSARVMKALQSADFVVVMSPFITETMKKYADIILPIAPFSETAGTFINAEGRWQSFNPVTIPDGEIKPAWKILRVLGNLFELKNFDYQHSVEIRDEIKQIIDTAAMTLPDSQVHFPEQLVKNENKLIRLSEWPQYCVDSLVRRSQPLQQILNDVATIRINSSLAIRLQLHDGQLALAIQGDSEIKLPIKIDERIANNNVLIPAGLAQTAGFGEANAEIIVRSA